MAGTSGHSFHHAVELEATGLLARRKVLLALQSLRDIAHRRGDKEPVLQVPAPASHCVFLLSALERVHAQVGDCRGAQWREGLLPDLTERVSPRVLRVVALPAASDRETSQMYFQRDIPHQPTAGEIVIVDRSGYSRTGVERVMGCTDQAVAKRFMSMAPGSRGR